MPSPPRPINWPFQENKMSSPRKHLKNEKRSSPNTTSARRKMLGATWMMELINLWFVRAITRLWSGVSSRPVNTLVNCKKSIWRYSTSSGHRSHDFAILISYRFMAKGRWSTTSRSTINWRRRTSFTRTCRHTVSKTRSTSSNTYRCNSSSIFPKRTLPTRSTNSAITLTQSRKCGNQMLKINWPKSIRRLLKTKLYKSENTSHIESIILMSKCTTVQTFGS